MGFWPGRTELTKEYFEGGRIPEPVILAVIFSDRSWVGDRTLVDKISEDRRAQYEAVQRVTPILEQQRRIWKDQPSRALHAAAEAVRVLADEQRRSRPQPPNNAARVLYLNNYAQRLESYSGPDDEWDVANWLEKTLDDLHMQCAVLKEQAFIPTSEDSPPH